MHLADSRSSIQNASSKPLLFPVAMDMSSLRAPFGERELEHVAVAQDQEKRSKYIFCTQCCKDISLRTVVMHFTNSRMHDLTVDELKTWRCVKDSRSKKPQFNLMWDALQEGIKKNSREEKKMKKKQRVDNHRAYKLELFGKMDKAPLSTWVGFWAVDLL